MPDISVEQQLKELVLDEDFAKLQNFVSEEVNLMSILRVTRKELAHSNFLAWLFNPRENHNLGDIALKEFMKTYFRENQYQDLGTSQGSNLSVFDFVQMNFDDIEIRREYEDIDLLFLSKRNDLCIVIENKIYSGEGEKQLEKYHKTVESQFENFKHRIYIYLSLEEQEISDFGQRHYLAIQYDSIIRILEQLLSSKNIALAEKVRFVLEQYKQTLHSMKNDNQELEQIAQRLFKRYRAAFDFVFQYAVVKEGSAIWDKLQSLILENKDTMVPFKSNTRYVRFQPKFLHEIEQILRNSNLLSDNPDWENFWLFLCEFNLSGDKVTFDFKIGKGDSEAREKLYNIYKKNDKFFNKINARKNLSPEWHLAFQVSILSKDEYQKCLESDEWGILKSRFNDLRSTLVEIQSLLEKSLTQNNQD